MSTCYLIYIYFVYERFVFYESNNCDINTNLLGCFKPLNI